MDDEFTSLIEVIGQAGAPIARALSRLAASNAELSRQIADQQVRLRNLEQLADEFANEQRDHEAWLANLSQRRTEERLTAGDYIVHQEISKRYRDLICQELLDVAVTAGASGHLAEAMARAGLARVLFEPAAALHGPESAVTALRDAHVAVADERVQQLWRTAEEIRADVAASGHSHRFVFDAEPGAAIDQSWQEPCDGCDAGDPVRFVVAPAYLVDDKFYVKQLVFTGHEQAVENQSEPPAAEGAWATTPGPSAGVAAAGGQIDASRHAARQRRRWLPWRRSATDGDRDKPATPRMSDNDDHQSA